MSVFLKNGGLAAWVGHGVTQWISLFKHDINVCAGLYGIGKYGIDKNTMGVGNNVVHNKLNLTWLAYSM